MFVETMVKACERVQNETGQRILNNARTEDKYVKKVNEYARTTDSEDSERYENQGGGCCSKAIVHGVK